MFILTSWKNANILAPSYPAFTQFPRKNSFINPQLNVILHTLKISKQISINLVLSAFQYCELVPKCWKYSKTLANSSLTRNPNTLKMSQYITVNPMQWKCPTKLASIIPMLLILYINSFNAVIKSISIIFIMHYKNDMTSQCSVFTPPTH
jgi:hypothetical protein